MNLKHYKDSLCLKSKIVLIFNIKMTKRSLIHPKLKTALSSLDLEIEAEINRYQNQKSSHREKNSFLRENLAIIPQSSYQQPKEIDTWQRQAVTNIQQPAADGFGVFKQPLGIASIIITIIGSSLLGINLNKPVQVQSTLEPSESITTPALVQGVNLASEEIELNLQTLSTLNNPQIKLITQSPTQSNNNRQPQSQLFNQLLLNQTTERKF
jgi:hypothetical protein